MANSTSFSHYAGIDVSKNTLDIQVLPHGKHTQVTNDATGIKQLLNLLPEHTAVLLEATGGYERLCADKLQEQNRPVCVINPKWVYHFKKSHNQGAKTDKIDAMILAQFAQARSELRYGLTSKLQRTLTEWHQVYSQLKELMKQERNRLTTAYSDEVKCIHERVIDALKEEITTLEDKMVALIKEDEERVEVYQRVQTLPGVGKITALALVCELPELGYIPRKAIGRLIGVAPMANDSGQYHGKRFIQGGRRRVRNALYMATLVATKQQGVIQRFYEKKCDEGKPKKMALVACMNKMAHILNTMIEKKTDYQAPDCAE